MNNEFLKNLAKKNPAIARLIELSLYSAFTYALTAITTGEVLSYQALVVALATPVLSAVSKHKRDLEKSNK